MTYQDTSLQFVMPSPNMPTVKTALVYPGMALIEGTNVSEGRGTTRPFELTGAPWINAKDLTDALNAKHLPGVRFRAAHFTPTFSKYNGEMCNGIQVHVLNKNSFNPVVTGLTVVKTIHDMYPDQFSFRSAHFDHLIGNDWVREGIKNGMSVGDMKQKWEDGLKQFKQKREQYLLY
jgi:beta-N-acetylhexosaminidase